MTAEKKEKLKIVRRPAGLVITPPKPRPVESDHPARMLLKDAIENEKAKIEQPAEPDSSKGIVSNEVIAKEAAELTTEIIQQEQPLKIFQDLKDAASDEAIQKEDLAVNSPFAQNTKPEALTENAPEIRSEQLKGISLTVNPQRDSIEAIKQHKEDFAVISTLIFEDFENSFRKRLSKAQLRICKVLFEKTYARGKTTCLIRVNDLMQLALVKRRNLFLSLNELEKAGFIDRGAVYNTPTKRGLEISFYPEPQIKKEPPRRTFHYIDDFS